MKKESLTKSQIIKMTPTDIGNLKKIAYMQHLPVNRILNTLTKKYIQENMELVKKHDELFPA